MSRKKRYKSESKWKKKLVIFFAAVFILAGAAAIYAYQSVNNVLDGETWHSSKRTEQVDLEQREAFTVLLLGMDELDSGTERSDTMVLVSVRPDSVKMLSLPRDTRVEIAGQGTKDKINHAYVFGGAKMAAETVESFLDVPVDYYVKMNMEGLKQLVDAVGGVDVNNSFAFSYDGIPFAEGMIHLTGSEALSYIRMRDGDPDGDFGRQKRQRQLVRAFVTKAAAPGNVMKYRSIFTAVESNVQTNLSFGDVVSIQQNYSAARSNIESESINGTGEKINGTYYYIVPPEEQRRLSELLRGHLGL